MRHGKRALRFRDLSESKQDQSAVELYEREVRGANPISPWCTLEPLDQSQDRSGNGQKWIVGQMIRVRRQYMNTLGQHDRGEIQFRG